MVFTKRERRIAIVAGLAVGGLLFHWYVFTPVLEWRERVTRDHQTLQTKVAEAGAVFRKHQAMQRKWDEIRASGLKHEAAEAEGQILSALRRWAQDSGLVLTSLKPERTGKSHDLRELAFQAVGTGNMRAVAGFLYRLETAGVPVRVREVQISARTEGTDDLSLHVRVSTLCSLPEPASGTTATTTVARGEEHP